MPGGRPKLQMPTVEWKLYVRADLAARVELFLADPMRERVKYGARGKLIESLLERWLSEQREIIMRAIPPNAEELDKQKT